MHHRAIRHVPQLKLAPGRSHDYANSKSDRTPLLAPLEHYNSMAKWFQRRKKTPDSALTRAASAIYPSGIKLLHESINSNVEYVSSYGSCIVCPPLNDLLSSIVFIHGLKGDREKTWTAPGSIEPWPKTLLPTKLPTARILTFGYDAHVVDWHGVVSRNRIGDHAWNLLTALARYRDEDGVVGLQNYAKYYTKR